MLIWKSPLYFTQTLMFYLPEDVKWTNARRNLDVAILDNRNGSLRKQRGLYLSSRGCSPSAFFSVWYFYSFTSVLLNKPMRDNRHNFWSINCFRNILFHDTRSHFKSIFFQNCNSWDVAISDISRHHLHYQNSIGSNKTEVN